MAYLLLVASQVAGLLLIPLGLPGLWVQVGGLIVYGWFTGFASIGATSIIVVLALAFVAEAIEFFLGARYARRYGGGRRAAWGAVLGGVAGALVGVPLPVVGSIIGAFVGSFVGAAVLEMSAVRKASPALRAGWGALLGRITATVVKVGIGVSLAVVVLAAALY